MMPTVRGALRQTRGAVGRLGKVLGSTAARAVIVTVIVTMTVPKGSVTTNT